MPRTGRGFFSIDPASCGGNNKPPGYIHTCGVRTFHFLCCGPGIRDRKSQVYTESSSVLLLTAPGDTILIVLAIDNDDNDKESYTFRPHETMAFFPGALVSSFTNFAQWIIAFAGLALCCFVFLFGSIL